jgi:U4/U6.U5 tri-snRNP-associated protein 2
VLSPKFTPAAVKALSSPEHLTKPSYDLSSKPYLPGYVGLNNIKKNDHMNVVIHTLLHIPPLRDNLLLSNYHGKEPELLKRFATLAKKIWNPQLFKSQVSPHEFLQEVNRASAGKFSLEQQGDPVEFLGWLLNRLHKDLGGTKKKNSSEFLAFLFVCGAVWGKGSLIIRGFFVSYRRHLLHIPRRAESGDTASHCPSRCC